MKYFHIHEKSKYQGHWKFENVPNEGIETQMFGRPCRILKVNGDDIDIEYIPDQLNIKFPYDPRDSVAKTYSKKGMQQHA